MYGVAILDNLFEHTRSLNLPGHHTHKPMTTSDRQVSCWISNLQQNAMLRSSQLTCESYHSLNTTSIAEFSKACIFILQEILPLLWQVVNSCKMHVFLGDPARLVITNERLVRLDSVNVPS
jgi:hypothetical protein